MSRTRILLLLVAALFVISGCKPSNPASALGAKEQAIRAKNVEMMKKQNKLIEDSQKLMNTPVPNPKGVPDMPKVGVPPALQPPSGAPAPFIPESVPPQKKQ